MILSPGARNALLSADARGWIHPPLPHMPTKRDPHPPATTWKTAHVNELERAGCIDFQRRRYDGLYLRHLSPAGRALKASLL